MSGLDNTSRSVTYTSFEAVGALVGLSRCHCCRKSHPAGSNSTCVYDPSTPEETLMELCTERGTEERLGEWEPEQQLVQPEVLGALLEDISPALKDIEAVG